MSLYTDKVMDHFEHPRNVGVIEDADGVRTIRLLTSSSRHSAAEAL